MDVVKILRERIDGLEPGDYTAGLRAIQQHVEVAANHLTRGARKGDETAFTDAVYRCNQAFEGSLKEAYRVLAGKDPSKKKPADIETYIQEQGVLRPRVLDQFSTYRRNWRNPSTHDYKLDFDEDEALLAIVSVCAFAIVLVDQIAGKISHDRALAAPKMDLIDPAQPLVDVVADQLKMLQIPLPPEKQGGPVREAEVLGTISGYLSSLLPESKVETEVSLTPSGRERADLLISGRDARVLVEVKRGKFAEKNLRNSLSQMIHYMALSGLSDAILYFYDDEGHHEMEAETSHFPDPDKKIVVIRPSRRVKKNRP